MRHLPRLTVAATMVFSSMAAAQDLTALRTAPERTEFRETTRYDEVVEFVEAVSTASPLVHRVTFGYTQQGRALPLAVIGRIPDGSPEAVRAAGRTVVYLQANIHAGEVEGKEVLLMLLREIAEGRHVALLDSLILLVAPIFNADGNEAVQLDNRDLQHGPIGGTGTRANAQGLNINRDHMKLDTPEARSFVRLLRDYDPHLAIDLHTTNGTRHAYHLTYSPPLHPNTHPALITTARERLLPEVADAVRRGHGWEFYYYGNLEGQGDARGWYTFDYRALFNNNYLGLRNRLGLLSEAYAYATFEDRILATRYFVEETLRYAHANASDLRRAVAAADAESIVGQTLAVRAAFERSPEPVEILLGEVVEERNPYSGATMLRRAEVRRPERMWEYGTFAATATEQAPRAYLVPAGLTAVLHNLADHGVATEPLESTAILELERFRIQSQQVAAQPFEGRVERTIEGVWEPVSLQVPAGTVRISVEQPLGRLVFSLLEPRSSDGLATWGTLGSALDGAESYPILRVP